MFDARPIVVALGGHAIAPPGEQGDIPHQFRHMQETAVRLADLAQAGWPLVVTHGNGPQVGNALRRVELAAHEVYPLPLDVCGADTQGGMGYMIALCLDNELHRRGSSQTALAVVTIVEVAADDPEFGAPTKPIGPEYSAERADRMRRHGWEMREVSAGRFRRVVPSPRPRAILGVDLLRRLAREGILLIAAGGGGVPVVRTTDGAWAGVEAVIDKDRTSALLAGAINAATLLIVSDVDRVYRDFGRPAQRPLDRLTVAEARRDLAGGHFPPGSMGPKIEAAVSFVEESPDADARAIICDLDHMLDALAGRAGTIIVAR